MLASSAPQEGKLSVGGQAKDSVKSSQGCDTHHDCGLCILHREPAAFSAGDPRKNRSVLSTPSTLPTLFLKLVFILLHWVSVVALRPSCSEACRDLCSQARDQTISPCTGKRILKQGTTSKVPLPALQSSSWPFPLLQLLIQFRIIPKSSVEKVTKSGKKVEAVIDFTFLGSKITAEGDCSHKIKRHLLLGRKTMTNLECVLKSKDITLLTKGLYSQSYGFTQ